MSTRFEFPHLSKVNFFSVKVDHSIIKQLQDSSPICAFLPSVLVSDNLKYLLLFSDMKISVDIQHPFVVCRLNKLFSHVSNQLKGERLVFRLIPVFSSDYPLFYFNWAIIDSLIDIKSTDRYIELENL